MSERYAERHSGAVQLLGFFDWRHLPAHLQAASRPFCELAERMFDQYGDGPEFTAGLRKLMEAKDCFVRHAIVEEQAAEARRLAGQDELDVERGETADDGAVSRETRWLTTGDR